VVPEQPTQPGQPPAPPSPETPVIVPNQDGTVTVTDPATGAIIATGVTPEQGNAIAQGTAPQADPATGPNNH
jgi:hypothetical protein